jgi:hypothetical protein
MLYVTRGVSFRWDEEFIAQVKAAAGDVPVSRYVRRAIEERIARDEQPVAASRSDAFRRATQKEKTR